jgi:hypothetical protein
LSTRRVLVAGESPHLEPRSVLEALACVNGRYRRVTIAGVATPPPLIWLWAPLTGVVTLDLLGEQLLAETSEAARLAAAALPRDIGIQYQTVHRWTDALVLAAEHDVLVLAGPPRRRRDRRAIVRSGMPDGEAEGHAQRQPGRVAPRRSGG